MPTRHPAVSVAFTLLFALACGKSPDGPPPPSGPALKIVAGGAISDTIQAMPTQGLVVQVRGPTGEVESGVAVAFKGCRDPGSSGYDYNYCSRLMLAPALSGAWDYDASATTDAVGRAVVRVRMGSLVGAVSIKITVPVYGLADSATIVVLPGAPFAVRTSPRDTTVELGSTFAPRAAVVDRAGNMRSDPLTFDATTSAVQVGATGSVSAQAPGRAYVRVRAADGSITAGDSTGILVVPKGRLALSNGDLRLQSLAGGPVRQLASGDTRSKWGPAWSPTGDRIAYFSDVVGLSIADTLGQTTALPTPGVTSAASPQYSRDGLWIYFEGNGTQIFRVHPDGSGLESLLRPTENGRAPSPSPDGTRFAYSSGGLLIKTIATGRVDTLSAASSSVMDLRWSPDGNWIAYTTWLDISTLAIGLIRPDGSGQHIVSARPYGNLSWSPDSKWLVAGATQQIRLVDVTTGTVYYLPISAYHVAWRP